LGVGVAVSPGSRGLGTSFGGLGFSSGALPAERMVIILLSISNQNGAPIEAAPAVNNKPKNFVSHHQKIWVDELLSGKEISQPIGMPSCCIPYICFLNFS
jgi:hypothetical protein